MERTGSRERLEGHPLACGGQHRLPGGGTVGVHLWMSRSLPRNRVRKGTPGRGSESRGPEAAKEVGAAVL